MKHTLTNLKRIEIIKFLPSEYNGIKQEINNKNITIKSPKTWRLNKTLLVKTWDKEEISRKILKYILLKRNRIYQNWCDVVKTIHKRKSYH